MKSFFIALVLLQYFPVQSQIKWDGEGNDGRWSTISNWVGNTLPSPDDKVILDNSFIAGNYTVTLPDTTIAIVSLSISPSTGNSIHVILPPSNLQTSNAIVTTGDVYGLDINKGGVFQNSSGSVSGTVLSISDSIRINNGGLYKHNTRSAHAAYVSILSRAAGTENGIFEFDVPSAASYAVSISNRVYGTLVFSATAAGGLKSYFSSGANPIKIRGDWHINSGVTYGLDLNDTVFVEGNFIQHVSSKFNLANGSNSAVLFLKKNIIIDTIIRTGTGSPQIHIAGNTNQTITSTTSLSNPANWFMNNSSGATLITNLTLSAALTLQAGKIVIGSNTLSVAEILNASADRYIITNGTGYLKMSAGINPVIFSVGPDSISYNPVTISNGEGINYSIRTEPGINPAIAFPTYGINRTWTIFTSSNPLVPVTASFQYDASHANPGCAPAGKMELLRYIPPAWNIISPDLVPSGSDPFVVTTSINSFNSPFAIGTNGGWILPLQFIQFDVVKSGMSIIFKWMLSTGISPETKIEIESSRDGLNFIHLASIQGRNTVGSYKYQDILPPGISYYRLRLIDVTGTVFYSRIVSISNNDDKTFITSLKPLPVHDIIRVTIRSPRNQKIRMIITDGTGRIVQYQDQQLRNGSNGISLNSNRLANGSYNLFCITTTERSNIIRFIKF